MAYMGHWLHFSYSDMLDMNINDFISFCKQMQEIAKNGNSNTAT